MPDDDEVPEKEVTITFDPEELSEALSEGRQNLENEELTEDEA